jgi:hypothetical protein
VQPQVLGLGDVGDVGDRVDRAGFVVPTLGATRNGRSPSARSRVICVRNASGSIRSSSSVATIRTFRLEKPAIVAAFGTLACACSLT